MPEGLGRSGILPRRLDRQCGASVVTARDAIVNRTEIPIMSPKKLTDSQLVLLAAAAQTSSYLERPVAVRDRVHRSPVGAPA
jgi:hypothetical protein